MSKLDNHYVCKRAQRPDENWQTSQGDVCTEPLSSSTFSYHAACGRQRLTFDLHILHIFHAAAILSLKELIRMIILFFLPAFGMV